MNALEGLDPRYLFGVLELSGENVRTSQRE